MRKYRLIILLFVSVLLTGCFEWDQSGCWDTDNCILKFKLAGDGGITGKVNFIDYHIFDDKENCVEQGRFKVSDKDEENILVLSLPAGDYHIICWGNISDGVDLVVGSDIKSSFVEITGRDTGAELYYGPCTQEKKRSGSTRVDPENVESAFTISGTEILEKDIPFVRSHRTVNVYVKDIEMHEGFDGSMPRVEYTSMPFKYDFYQNPREDRCNYEQVMREVQISGQNFLKAGVQVPVSDIEGDMNIRFKYGSENAVVYTYNLQDWVDQNQPKDINFLELLFTVKGDEDVTVTLPDWGSIGAIPEF